MHKAPISVSPSSMFGALPGCSSFRLSGIDLCDLGATFGHPWAAFGHPWDPFSYLVLTLGRGPGVAPPEPQGAIAAAMRPAKYSKKMSEI